MPAKTPNSMVQSGAREAVDGGRGGAPGVRSLVQPGRVRCVGTIQEVRTTARGSATLGSKEIEVADSGSDLVDQEAVESALGVALARGGEFAEVFIEDRRSTGISLDDRKIEELSSGRDRGAGIRVIVGDTTGFAHTADLSAAGLIAAAEAASSIARSGGSGSVAVGLQRQHLDSTSAVVIAPKMSRRRQR
jgi:hypothetical protein